MLMSVAASVRSSIPNQAFTNRRIPRQPSVPPSVAPRPSIVLLIVPSMAAQSIANNISNSRIVSEKVKLLIDAIKDLQKLGL